MRAHSPSHRHHRTSESQATASYYDPSRRWSRRATTAIHSPRSEPRMRVPSTLEPSLEEVAAGDTNELVNARLRSLGAAYGSATPFVAAAKSLSPPPQLTGPPRSALGFGGDGLLVRGDGTRYNLNERRRSSIGATSLLIAPPPLTLAGTARDFSTTTTTTSTTAVGDDAAALYGLAPRGTARSSGLSALHSARLSGAAGAGAPLRSRSRGHPTSSVPTPTPTTTTPSPAPAPCAYLIPPPAPEDAGKLVVVLDLDETLVYSRDVTLYERPNVAMLLKTLKGRCELIVWTAGTREYALDVIKVIDTVCAVQHCIYRHPMWWTGDAGCAKDLRLLGRPMDRVVLVDNTPSVFSANPRHSILVSDFMVPYPRAYDAHEKTLATLADIFDHFFRRFPQPCVADVLASKRITRQLVYLERGNALELNVLSVRSTAAVVETSWATSTRASRLRYSP